MPLTDFHFLIGQGIERVKYVIEHKTIWKWLKAELKHLLEL